MHHSLPMLTRLTLAHLLLFGCASSHDTRDAGTDASTGLDSTTGMDGTTGLDGTTGFPDSCPPLAAPVCARGACCDDVAAPVGECGFDCPAGFSATCEVDPRVSCVADLLSCDQPSDCVVIQADNTCCGVCPWHLSVDDAIAVNAGRIEDYRATRPPAECPVGISCGPCAPRDPLDDHLVATCEASVCRIAPIRATALTRCTDSSECRVRALSCCECGADLSEENLVAVRNDSEGALGAILCGDRDFACPECAPDYPWVAYCAEDGHCALARPE